MSLYKLKYGNDLKDEIVLSVVEDYASGGSQTTVIYESPGSNTGAVLMTGRTNKKINLTGKIISKPQMSSKYNDIYHTDLSNKITKIEDVRDKGTQVTLIAPITSNDTGIYIIDNFTYNYSGGNVNSISFVMSLTEYRQKNVKQTAVNLVNFQPGELMKQRARDRNIMSG